MPGEVRFVSVTPTVPPAIDGLADYSRMLWKHWPGERASWHCLACRIPQGADAAWPGVTRSPFERSSSALLQALEEQRATHVLLHYSGYGYHPKGCPIWLPQALQTWRRGGSGRRLTTVFHEMYATGKPWSSAFWLSRIQKQIVRNLLAVSDGWTTSCTEYYDKLLAFDPAARSRGELVPIGSNIDPIERVDFARPWPLGEGSRLNLAIFGLPQSRLTALRLHHRLMAEMVSKNLVAEIALIGKSDDSPTRVAETQTLLDRIGPAGLWSRQFDLSAPEVSAVLLRAHVGIVPSVPSAISKSGTYAAFVVHGIRPVIPAIGECDPEGMFPYITNDESNPEACRQALTDAALMGRLGERLRAAAEGPLSWEHIAGRVCQIALGKARQ